MTVASTVFRLIVVAGLTNCVTFALLYDDCIHTNSQDGSSPGKCVPFPECPFLFDIIKSPHKTSAEIKMLQQLTCGFEDEENPLVCCSVDDLLASNKSSDYSVANKIPNRGPEIEKTNQRIFFGSDVPEGEEKVKTAERMSIPKLDTKDSDGDHPNFRLLPTIKECSKNVLGMRILGGNETSITQYPWMARIGYYSYDEGIVKYLCAGTVINKRYILTASHCLEEINPEEFSLEHIRVAERDRECDETFGCHTPKDIKIEKVIPHPNYSRRDKSNDIGLIRLAEDIKFEGNLFTQPVCLPFVEEYGLKKEDLDPDLTKFMDTGKTSGYVAGWGKTRWNNLEGSEFLQHVALPVLSLQACQKAYENHRRVFITNLQLCAGGDKGKDSCGGDSGGGLFISEKVPIVGKIKSAKMFQFGVVSFGPTHCGVGGLPGVYSNTYKYKNWILDQLEP